MGAICYMKHDEHRAAVARGACIIIAGVVTPLIRIFLVGLY